MKKEQKKILIVVGHPDKKSFCWNGIYKTATRQMRKHKQSYRVIDLYRDMDSDAKYVILLESVFISLR